MENVWKIGIKKKVSVKITDQMVRQFAELSGDRNPIHLDEEHAKKTRFGRRIAHGMISGAIISRALAMELGSGGIYLSQTLKFLKPVFIDETIHVELTVTHLREEKGIATVETLVTKDNGDLVVKGEAIIMRGENV